MDIVKVKIADIKIAKYNPRKDLMADDTEYKRIEKSLEMFGMVEPVILNKDNTLISGHQRLKVLKAKGYEEVDASYVDLSEMDEKTLNVALNKIKGEWNYEKLRDLMQELKEDEADLEITGFDDFEIKMLTETHSYIDDLLEDDFTVNASEKPMKEFFGMTIVMNKEYQDAIVDYANRNSKKPIAKYVLERIGRSNEY